MVGGNLEQIHPSAANDWLVKDSNWFTINYNEVSNTLKYIYENHGKCLEMSRKNRKFVKDNFTIRNMTELLGEILQKHNVGKGPQQVTLQLPKLKKVNG